MTKNLSEIGGEIIRAARNELSLSLPFMNLVFSALIPAPGDEVTFTMATDGELLYYDGGWLSDRYLRSRVFANRAYLHVILHCMLRHIYRKKERIPGLWDLACDAAVESIIDSMDYRCLGRQAAPARQKFFNECLSDMKVLTAEGIYVRLVRLCLPEYELSRLHRLFAVDDHSLWISDKEDEERKRQDRKWRDLADSTKTAMETVFANQATGGDAILEQIRVAVRDDVDYRAFLRRFAAQREIIEVDGDAFDYIYYTYGLRVYGNMPLIEPPETREEKRIEDFVIAVDTSMSTSGEMVRAFLSSTYAILRSTETFTRKVHIRIIQCDNEIRADDEIRDLSELRNYMEHFRLIGGSATDFRPVFAHVAELIGAGVFTQLRGLIYFTDGMGIYPEKRTPYETAFVLLEEPPVSVKFPPWAVKLVLGMPELAKARAEAAAILAEEGIDLSELPAT